MKRINIILAVLLIFSTSCNNWLELEPENEVIKKDFWQTQVDVESVLWSAYSGLQNLHRDIIQMGEARGDGVDLLNNAGLNKIRLGTVTPNDTYASWANWYKVINFCNLVIAESSSVLGRDINYFEEEHNAIIAEAKVLRALAYFYIVRLWKDAPLIVAPYDTDEQAYLKKKDSEETILNFCKNDLEESIPFLKDSYTQEWEIYARITKTAAQTLMADVCLYSEDYESVIKYCDEILNGGLKKLEAGEDWFDLFLDDFSNESIFEIGFDRSLNQWNQLFQIYYNNNNPLFAFAEHWEKRNLYSESDIRGVKATYNESNRFILKYVSILPSKPIYIGASTSDFNFKIYRLAEVYFMKAEAHVMLQQYNEAEELMGIIRERAGLGQSVLVAANIDAWINFLLEEKLREFMGEGKRWFDLLRIGKKNNWERKDLIINTLLEFIPSIDAAKMESVLQNPYAYYLPIHSRDIEFNNLLEQNPYYK